MSKQSNDVILITAYFIRMSFEQNSRFVPIGIKNIILIYSKRCIVGTTLLSLPQDTALFEMFKKYIKGIKGFTLLYRGSENEFSAKIFEKKCVGLDKLGQIVIIKSNHDTIFGGYISKDWSKQSGDCDFIQDDCAFIYLVQSDTEELNAKCPKYFPIKSSHKHIAISRRTGVGDWECGPCFGMLDIYIADKCNEKGYVWDMDTKEDEYYSKNYTCFEAYQFEGEGFNLCGGQNNLDGTFDVVDYEVFKVVTQD